MRSARRRRGTSDRDNKLLELNSVSESPDNVDVDARRTGGGRGGRRVVGFGGIMVGATTYRMLGCRFLQLTAKSSGKKEKNGEKRKRKVK